MQHVKVGTLVILPYILFAFAYFSHHKNKPAWFTRKLIHVFGLFLVGMYGSFLNTIEEVFYVILFFLIFLMIFSLTPQIKMFQTLIKIGTREGERQAESIVNITVTSISILLLLAISFLGFIDRAYFFAGVLSVAFGDGLGEFIGKPYGNRKYQIVSEKSVEGSIGVLIGTYLGCILAFAAFNLRWFEPNVLGVFLLVSFLAMTIEALSKSFLDNVFMPWGVSSLLWFLI